MALPSDRVGVRPDQVDWDGRIFFKDNYDKIIKELKLSNRNLLDNAWFVNPVNQRGITTFSANSYGIDRWKNIYLNSADATISVVNDGIKFDVISGENANALIDQIIEKSRLDISKGYTLSLILNNGKIISFTSTNVFVHNDDNIILSLTEEDSTHYRVRVWIKKSGSFTIRAVKLELGYICTIVNDVAPNFTEELLKCKRYYQRILYGSQNYAGMFFANSTLSVIGSINLQVPMRDITNILYNGNIQFYDGTNSYQISGMTLTRYNDEQIRVTCTGDFTSGKVGTLFANDNSSYIEVNADL